MDASARAISGEQDLPLGQRFSTIRTGQDSEGLARYGIDIKTDDGSAPYDVGDDRRSDRYTCGNESKSGGRSTVGLGHVGGVRAHNCMVEIDCGIIGGIGGKRTSRNRY